MSPRPQIDESQVQAWFAGRVPQDWFEGGLEVIIDSDEVTVLGTLAEVKLDQGAGDEATATARRARIEGFREDTREQRMRIAADAEARLGRSVAWAARCGDQEQIFTSASVPVMTRLRQRERRVLDTLVEAGVARSRSHALNWCVRLVEQHQGEWINELRAALVHVEKVRGRGPVES